MAGGPEGPGQTPPSSVLASKAQVGQGPKREGHRAHPLGSPRTRGHCMAVSPMTPQEVSALLPWQGGGAEPQPLARLRPGQGHQGVQAGGRGQKDPSIRQHVTRHRHPSFWNPQTLSLGPCGHDHGLNSVRTSVKWGLGGGRAHPFCFPRQGPQSGLGADMLAPDPNSDLPPGARTPLCGYSAPIDALVSRNPGRTLTGSSGQASPH